MLENTAIFEQSKLNLLTEDLESMPILGQPELTPSIDININLSATISESTLAVEERTTTNPNVPFSDRFCERPPLGTLENDNLLGNSCNNSMYGYAGNDTIRGYGGDDFITGNEGSDRLFGGSGIDNIFGDSGDDRLFGESGRDILYGGEGSDWLDGGRGDDRLFGESGRDILYGGEGSDWLFGGSDNDTLAGVNIFAGNPGLGEIDTLRGGGGNDVFELGSANNYYYNDTSPNNSENFGTNDYALIEDFMSGDLIQLNGSPDQYEIIPTPSVNIPDSTLPSAAIFRREVGLFSLDLVGVVQLSDDTSALNLNDSSQFTYVG